MIAFTATGADGSEHSYVAQAFELVDDRYVLRAVMFSKDNVVHIQDVALPPLVRFRVQDTLLTYNPSASLCGSG